MKALIITFLLLSSQILFAQTSHNVEVVEIYNKKVSGSFNEEWQYLTTDLYLMNMDKIEQLLDDVWAGEKRKKQVKSVFISAELKGTILTDVSYPLYNFQADEATGKIQANYRDKVRIMKNYPISSISDDRVSAAIRMEIITADKGNTVYSFVTQQLKNIASYSTPISAAKTLTGELSNLMESKIRNTKYEFSSTIDIYKDDFSKQLYSIGVYLFKPQNSTYTTSVKSLVNIDNDDINKNNILNYIGEVKYPFLVSVNYKSKYISPFNITSDITDESVLQRKLDIKNKYDNRELNQKLYAYEQTLNGFLEEFVRLSKSEKNFTDNKNRTNQEGRNQMLLDLMESYRTFYNLYCQRNREYEDDVIFNDIFKGHYNDILKLADKNMARNSELKNIMELVKCSERYEEDFTKTFKNSDIERDLSILQSVRLPQDSEFEQRITDLISKIETLYFNRDFAPLMTQLASGDNQKILTDLKNRYAITNCQSCKPKLQNAIAQYDSQIAEEQRADAIIKMNSLKTASRTILITSQNLIQDIGAPEQYPNDGFKKNVEALQEKQQKLQDLVNKDYATFDAAAIAEKIKVIESVKFEVESLTNQIKSQFEEIKKNSPTPTYSYTSMPKRIAESDDYQNALIKYNEAITLWQNYSKGIENKLQEILKFRVEEDIDFSVAEEQTFNSLVREYSRLSNITTEGTSTLTPYKLGQRTDDLKTSTMELVRKTDKFYNEFMEGY